MTSPSPVTMKKHLEASTSRMRWIVPALLSLVLSLSFFSVLLYLKIRSDLRLLGGIQAHVSSLVETQDRPELLRLLLSIQRESAGEIKVIENGLILASSGHPSELDRLYQPSSGMRLHQKVALTADGIVLTRPISRLGGPTNSTAVMIFTVPIGPTAIVALFSAFLVFTASLVAVRFFGKKLTQTVELSLKPIDDLREAIVALRSMDTKPTLKPSSIVELEEIRTTILSTHQSLIETREALAESRAKEVIAEAYRRLIHDLHNPVRCLNNLVLLTNSNDHDAATVREAVEMIPRIAEQILLQVETAKSHLNIETPKLESQDLRTCIQEAIEITRFAQGRDGENKNIELSVPSEPILHRHDRVLLGRAVSNLVRNAFEACRSKIQVSLEAVSDKLLITVSDDGPGIPEENVGLYLQGRKRSSKEDRPALGLAAANHIVRSHGGKIIYRRSPLGGACFEVRI